MYNLKVFKLTSEGHSGLATSLSRGNNGGFFSARETCCKSKGTVKVGANFQIFSVGPNFQIVISFVYFCSNIELIFGSDVELICKSRNAPGSFKHISQCKFSRENSVPQSTLPTFTVSSMLWTRRH